MVVELHEGFLREWNALDGWGIIDSEATPGGCWVSAAALDHGMPVELARGDAVWFAFIPAEQDGLAFRATQAFTVREPPD